MYMDDHSRFIHRDAAALEHERKHLELQKKEVRAVCAQGLDLRELQEEESIICVARNRSQSSHAILCT
jgi:hypothetical protein